jgi:hypothetical protein
MLRLTNETHIYKERLMMTCEHCKYFDKIKLNHADGECNIKLPPYIENYFVFKVFKQVRLNDSCDLFKKGKV